MQSSNLDDCVLNHRDKRSLYSLFSCFVNNDEADVGFWAKQRSHMIRFLSETTSESDSSGRLNVLAVTVITLGLIMIVELLKHRLETAVAGRQYFSAVLANIYSELSILGIVEVLLYLMEKYSTNIAFLHGENYYVFADVHFALFYTACFTAVQSIILAFIANGVSRRIWVQTEALELFHYVELREEFDRVRASMEASKIPKKAPGISSSHSSFGIDHSDINHPRKSSIIHMESRDNFYDKSSQGLRQLGLIILYWLKNPRLKNQYHDLLVQVRFHQLRVHFLQAYDLPPKLKISDYLIRCQNAVFMKLIRVKAVAWLCLLALSNLLFYIMGIVDYNEEKPEQARSYGVHAIYFGSMAVFVVLALIVFNKMKSIFSEIMHRPHLWESVDDEETRRTLAKEQISLFWGDSPKLVIEAIQFMQFGYAVALSIVLIFWGKLDDSLVPIVWYLAAFAACYTLFVFVAAHVIPQFTLCTSLGQLVNKKHLSETVANFHLDEAKLRQQEELCSRAFASSRFHVFPVGRRPQKHSRISRWRQKQPSNLSGTSSTVISSVDDERGRDFASPLHLQTSKACDTSVADSTPHPPGDNALVRVESRRERPRRQKALSDGVSRLASMRELGNEEAKEEIQQGAEAPAIPSSQNQRDLLIGSSKSSVPMQQLTGTMHLTGAEPSVGQVPRPRRIARERSVSDGVATMATSTKADFFSAQMTQSPESVRALHIAGLVKANTSQLRDLLPKEDLQRLKEKQSPTQRDRTRRTKTNSDPGAIQMMSGEDDGKANLDDSTASDRRSRRMKSLSDVARFMAFDASFLGKSDLSPSIKEVTASAEESEDDKMCNPQNDRTKSDDDESDNFSDIDDIPNVDLSHWRASTSRVHRGIEERTTLLDLLKVYFVSKTFPVVSFFVGTTAAFFLVGFRVEQFRFVNEDLLAQSASSFEDNISTSFWVLSSILLLFLIVDCLILCTVDRFVVNQRNRTIWWASVVDIVIVVVCFCVFWVAEGERCCHPPSNSNERAMLVESNHTSESLDNSGNYGPDVCSCPAFGSRIYGGLGSIEPWTSLIALRVFRFFVARTLVIYRDSKKGIQHIDDNYDLVDVDDHHHKHSKTSDGHSTVRGTAAELWQASVAKNPEIALKHGMFSSEILQVMLGLNVTPMHEQTTAELKEAPARAAVGKEESAAMPKKSLTETNPIDNGNMRQNRDETPSVNDQEVIKRGQSVKATFTASSLATVHTIPEADERAGSSSFQLLNNPSEALLSNWNRDMPFEVPNATLVRSMRRCDRKLIPILNTWVPVDVVLTRFEIVYFDASETFDCPGLEDMRDALTASKGGKGMRLKDVAVGRKVVGHLTLSDITSLAVERYMPCKEHGAFEDEAETKILETEFWKEEKTKLTSRNESWDMIVQDTMAVHTSHGSTLYLRFYADLEAAENHPERFLFSPDELQDSSASLKNNAFQWIKSISRFCGPDQLLQSLPHFGDDTDDELRDFLIIHDLALGEVKKKNVMFLAHHGPNLRPNETVGAAHAHTNRASHPNLRASLFQSTWATKDLNLLRDMEQLDDDQDGQSKHAVRASARRHSIFHLSHLGDGRNRERKTDTSPQRSKQLPKPTALRSVSHGDAEGGKLVKKPSLGRAISLGFIEGGSSLTKPSVNGTVTVSDVEVGEAETKPNNGQLSSSGDNEVGKAMMKPKLGRAVSVGQVDGSKVLMKPKVSRPVSVGNGQGDKAMPFGGIDAQK